MSEPQETEVEVDASQEIPGNLPVLPLRDTVVFPDTMIPLTIGQERSIKLIDDVLAGDRLLALVTSRDAEIETPGPELLHPVGTVGLAHKMIKLPDGTMRILVQGLQRVRTGAFTETEPYLRADVEKIEDVVDEGKEMDALRATLLSVFSKIVALVPYLPEELEMAAANVEEPGPLTFLVASTMRIKAEDKQALLEESDVEQRMRRLISILTGELDVLELGSKIQSDVRSEIDKGQREYFLRQQLKAIQQELGETDEQQAEIDELRRQGRRAELPGGDRQGGPPRAGPPRATSAGQRRVPRHPHLPGLDDHACPGACAARTTWTSPTRAQILDEDHYDLEKIKDRILEFLAVRKLEGRPARPDPLLRRTARRRQDQPGQVHRRRLGRKFVRISVGGVRDEAEIRGHRRTYVGAMPGSIIQGHARRRHQQPGLHAGRDRQDRAPTAAATRPAACWRCWTRSRTSRFRDHYLDVPFDLSKVMFITTANLLEPDPAAAARPHGDHRAGRLHRGREAAHRAQLPGAQSSSRPTASRQGQITFTDDAIAEIIRDYTREAGVRNLEREIGTSLPQAGARGRRAGERQPRASAMTVKRVHELLAGRASSPRSSGARRAPAWPPAWPGRRWAATSSSSRRRAMPGKRPLIVTGQLGDVMKESAQAALSYVRSHGRSWA